jgi:hypothetical protein
MRPAVQTSVPPARAHCNDDWYAGCDRTSFLPTIKNSSLLQWAAWKGTAPSCRAFDRCQDKFLDHRGVLGVTKIWTDRRRLDR